MHASRHDLTSCRMNEHARHGMGLFSGRSREGLMLLDRRGMLKASLAGLAGLSLPALLQYRDARANPARSANGGQSAAAGARKSVILLWMAGGPSQIDTWDPKPNRPLENRGPFGVTSTKLPGVLISEHLPKQAAMLDKFTLIRSVDARGSNHEPNSVMQTGNLLAEARTNPEAQKYPAIASLVAKHHGSNHPSMPPYVAFMRSRSHLAFGGYLGRRYDPFLANDGAKLPVYDLVGNNTGTEAGGGIFRMPEGLSVDRLYDRKTLLGDFDRLRRGLDQSGSMDALDSYHQMALDIVLGERAQRAFDLSQEDPAVRSRYGSHLWCQQVLLARRLVEAGVTFITLDLSYHTASGTWDTHGDNIPPYGGIRKGLGPLLPLYDHLVSTLVSDLDERGLLDQTLVVSMGEFGRTPNMGTQGSTDGRNHWPEVMSMCLAGGGLRHGQVIGASEPDGGHIKDRPVTPCDLAATIYRYFGIPTDITYTDERGRPRFAVEHGGQPLKELWA